MSYNLFLDDVRMPKDAWLYGKKVISLLQETEIKDWVIVRDYDEFTSMIRNGGIPSVVSFDHDLHFEHMRHYFDVVQKTGIVEYSKLRYKTGLACAEYLVRACHERGVPLPKCYVHSANEVGRENIKRLLCLKTFLSP
jgi:hypothetical protein